MDLLKAKTISCPYCGDPIDISVDCSIEYQQYIEDCQVCCRPIFLSVSVDEEHDVSVQVQHENE